jgi:hypothetical protein
VVSLKGILVALAVALVIVLGCLGTPGVAANEQDINFTIEDADLQFSASLSVSMEWDSDVTVGDGQVATIAYTPSPTTGSASVLIPLSALYDYFLIDLDDQVVNIPLPETPIGEVSISLTQALTGVPSTVGSVDVVIQSALSVSSITSTSGNQDVLTEESALRWTTWGEKSISVDMADESDATVTTVFQYAISIGVVATALEDMLEIELIPQTDIAGVTGSPSVQTQIYVEQNLLSQYLIPIVVIGAVAAVAVAAVMLAKKRKGRKIA